MALTVLQPPGKNLLRVERDSWRELRAAQGLGLSNLCASDRPVRPLAKVFRSARRPFCALQKRQRRHEHEMKATNVRTYTPKPGDIQNDWYVIDATDVILGRLATHVATLLRGKHKPTFAPHVDGGDFVIVINAEKVALSGNKLEQKKAYSHSGYPGGLSAIPYSELMEKNPAQAVEKAVRGMIPKTSLGRMQMGKLKVYAGSEHPHAAQQPKPFEITQVAQ